MYRKISLGLVSMSLLVLFATLWLFVPWFLETFKDLKVEMPFLTRWLISASNFVNRPWGAALLLTLCFFGVKALDQWAARRS